MDLPSNLLFTVDHLWLRQQADGFRIGITEFAQAELGDVIFTDIPRVGTNVDAGAAFGWLESAKTVVDLNAPISGTVVGANALLAGKPELINREPYGNGWICTIAPHSPITPGQFLDAQGYLVLLQRLQT